MQVSSTTENMNYYTSNTTKKNETDLTMEGLEEKYGSNFNDYLEKFDELTADGVISIEESAHMKPSESMVYSEIMKVKNAQGANIINEAYERFKNADISYPEELTTYMNNLIEDNMDNYDVNNVWMMMEIGKQYADYTNGKEPSSIFEVDENGKFFTEVSSSTSKINMEEFATKMLNTFIEKLANTDDKDMRENYQRLIDGYTELKEQLKNNTSNGTVFYA